MKYLAIAAALILIVAVLFSCIESRNWIEETYVVECGDTLWDIAKEYCPDDMSFREYINLIKTRNDITADIYEGDSIIILKEVK